MQPRREGVLDTSKGRMVSLARTYSGRVGDDPGTGCAGESTADGLWHGNQAGLASPLKIVDHRLDLWSHAATGKMAGGGIRPGLAEGDALEVALVGPAIVERDLLDGGGDEQEIGVQPCGEQAGGQIFVDHPLDA